MELTKLQLASVITHQVNKALDAFAVQHNAAHSAQIRFEVKEFVKEGTPDTAFPFVGVTEIWLFLNGVPSIWSRKTYGFHTKGQSKQEGEWKLTIWQDILKDICGTATLVALAHRLTPETERIINSNTPTL